MNIAGENAAKTGILSHSPGIMTPKKPDNRRSGWKSRDDGKAPPKKEQQCSVCWGPHHYYQCPKMKTLGAMLLDWETKQAAPKAESSNVARVGTIRLNSFVLLPPENPTEAPTTGEGSSTVRVGMIDLGDSDLQQPKEPERTLVLCADIMINGRTTRAVVDTAAEANVVTKAAAEKLGLKFSSSDAKLRMANAPLTPVCGIASGVDITLGNWHGKANFHVAPNDLFDIILGQPFFRQCPVLVSPYFQQLVVMGQEGTFTLPLRPMPAFKEAIKLSALQLVEPSQGTETLPCSSRRRRKKRN